MKDYDWQTVGWILCLVSAAVAVTILARILAVLHFACYH